MGHKHIFLILFIIISANVLGSSIDLSYEEERQMRDLQDLLSDGFSGFLVLLFWLIFRRRNNKKIGKAFAEYQSHIEKLRANFLTKQQTISNQLTDKKKKFEKFLKSLSKSEVFCLKCFSKNLVFKENKYNEHIQYLRKDRTEAKIKTTNSRIDFIYKSTDWECKKCNLIIHTLHKNVPKNFMGPPLNFIYSRIEVEEKYFKHVINEYRETGIIPSDLKSDWPGYEDLDDRNNYKRLDYWDYYFGEFEPPPFIKPKVFPAFISGFLMGGLVTVLYRLTIYFIFPYIKDFL